MGKQFQLKEIVFLFTAKETDVFKNLTVLFATAGLVYEAAKSRESSPWDSDFILQNTSESVCPCLTSSMPCPSSHFELYFISKFLLFLTG